MTEAAVRLADIGGCAAVAPLLSARGLRFSAGGQTLIRDLDLHFSNHGISVVMGPNGAGKSVLLRLLHGVLKADAGEVHYAGRVLDEETRRREQAMVFQRPVLLRRSVEANINYVLKLHGKADAGRCQALLEQVGLAAKLRQPARALSGGEQQRLAFARALAAEPRLLFLDEPTANLDPNASAMLEDLMLGAAADGIKLICVSHDAGQARRLATEVVFIHRGEVLAQQSADAFFDRPADPRIEDYLSGRLVL
ncbi:ATP-binding cassette domain-containing protein [Granulosicoccaceae sp. 1_MG-2023]|nr:ATP-binding cassette domain-containing protein [Granulosicoccaceae sp. 1_MG-2023]